MATINRVRNIDWGATGATLYYRIADASGGVLLARTHSGVTEFPAGSGNYRIVVAWDTTWAGEEVWDDGDAGGNNATAVVADAFDPLTGVGASGGGTPVASTATPTNAFLGGGVVRNTAVDLTPLLYSLALTHARIDDDTGQTAAINQFLSAAIEKVQEDTGQQLAGATFTFTRDGFPDSADDFMSIPLPPLQSVESISYIDAAGQSQTLSPSVYIVDTARRPGRVSLKQGQVWPTTADQRRTVTINFTAGYGNAASDIPSRLKMAVLLLFAGWYENREEGSDADIKALPMPIAAKTIIDSESFLEAI